MKTKNYTLIFMVFMGALNLNAQNVNIPDTNFKNALLNHNPVIDTNGDGEIQVSEAQALNGALVVDNSGISDLTGLEAFLNITELNCAGNNLTSIDISDNTALTELVCQTNNLTSLDVSNNLALTGLTCFGNQLTSLDVSSNVSLTSLGCNDNQLSGIDVSNNASLTNLNCKENNLISLDVTNNLALTALACDSNQLTGLDVSNNANLFLLLCQNNQLTSLNIANGNNSNLTNFFAMNNNLTCIQIDDDFTPPSSGWLKDAEAVYAVDCDALSISSHSLQEISIYPNPVQDVLQIETREQLQEITVYTLTGQEMFNSNKTRSINIGNLSQGMYLVKIDTERGSVYQKIVKK